MPLTLTKPLGLGVLNNRHKATGEVFPQAVATMAALNADAAQAALAAGRPCATDVTGFGLLGHLLQAGPGQRGDRGDRRGRGAVPGRRPGGAAPPATSAAAPGATWTGCAAPRLARRRRGRAAAAGRRADQRRAAGRRRDPRRPGHRRARPPRRPTSWTSADPAGEAAQSEPVRTVKSHRSQPARPPPPARPRPGTRRRTRTPGPAAGRSPGRPGSGSTLAAPNTTSACEQRGVLHAEAEPDHQVVQRQREPGQQQPPERGRRRR